LRAVEFFKFNGKFFEPKFSPFFGGFDLAQLHYTIPFSSSSTSTLWEYPIIQYIISIFAIDKTNRKKT
jgi:hypothetical protein